MTSPGARSDPTGPLHDVPNTRNTSSTSTMGWLTNPTPSRCPLHHLHHERLPSRRVEGVDQVLFMDLE